MIKISKVSEGENIVRRIGSYSNINHKAPEDGIIIEVDDRSNFENIYIRFSDLISILNNKDDFFVKEIDSWR